MKVIEAIEKYMKYVEVTKSDGMYRYETGKITTLRRCLGDLKCCEINNDVILDFIVKQRIRNKDITNRTLNKLISTLQRVLKYSVGINLKFNKLIEKKKIIPIIPPEVIDQIFVYYEKNKSEFYSFRNYCFYRLLYDTGLRLSEILNLRISNIQFDTNSIHVTITKTNKERFVFFTNKTKRLLMQFVGKHQLNNYLFTNRNHKKLTDTAVMTFTRRLTNKLAISVSVTPHKWRHTFATRFLKKSGDLETLRMILGHSNLKTTQMYLHLDKEHLLKVYRNAID